MREHAVEMPAGNSLPGWACWMSNLRNDAMPKGLSWFTEHRAVKLPTCALLVCCLAAGAGAWAGAAKQPPTIEKLIADGWDVAGYVWAGGNRSLILFKNKNFQSFVQCSVLVDVTRHPVVVTACYEIK